MSGQLAHQGSYLRQIAYEKMEEAITDDIEQGRFDTEKHSYIGTNIRFTELSPLGLTEWESEWSNHPRRRCSWDWREWYRSVVNSPSRLEAALWGNDELCGLIIGKLSSGREHLTVVLLEGAPYTHVLKGRVSFCLLGLAELYAGAWGCKRIIIKEPLDPVLPIYSGLGYSVATNRSNMIACVKELA